MPRLQPGQLAPHKVQGQVLLHLGDTVELFVLGALGASRSCPEARPDAHGSRLAAGRCGWPQFFLAKQLGGRRRVWDKVGVRVRVWIASIQCARSLILRRGMVKGLAGLISRSGSSGGSRPVRVSLPPNNIADLRHSP